MPSKSPHIFLKRKKLVESIRQPRPVYATDDIKSHRRPMETRGGHLLDLLDTDTPDNKVVTQPLEDTIPHEDGQQQ